MLEQQLADIEKKIRLLREEQYEVAAKLDDIYFLEAQASGKIDALPDRPVTARNFRFHQAWMAMQLVLDKAGPDGARTDQLKGKVADFNPSLKPATFRSYLHRLKEDGLLEKRSNGRWKLTDKAKKERENDVAKN